MFEKGGVSSLLLISDMIKFVYVSFIDLLSVVKWCIYLFASRQLGIKYLH